MKFASWFRGEVLPHEVYRLGFLPADDLSSPPKIAFSVREEFFQLFLERAMLVSFARGLKRLEAVKASVEFLTDVSKPWGVGGCISPVIKNEDGFYLFFISILAVETPMSDHKQDWSRVAEVVASLYVFCSAVESFSKVLTRSARLKQAQLLTFSVSFEDGHWSFSAACSPDFGDFLRSRSNTILSKVKAALLETWSYMFPSCKQFDDSPFDARVGPNGLVQICVPNLCLLYADGFDTGFPQSGTGMHLGSKGVYNFHQQVALLAGLAALSQEVQAFKDTKKS